MRLSILVSVLAAGCALFPLEQRDCVGVDWEKRGYAEGFAGHPQQFLRYQQECPRFGVTVPEAEYFRGYREGYNEWDRLIGSMQKRGP